MALTLSDLQAKRDALLSAMLSGALSVRHGDSSITYRSYAEMRQALADLDEQISDATGVTRVKMVRINTGWGG